MECEGDSDVNCTVNKISTFMLGQALENVVELDEFTVVFDLEFQDDNLMK